MEKVINKELLEYMVQKILYQVDKIINILVIRMAQMLLFLIAAIIPFYYIQFILAKINN